METAEAPPPPRTKAPVPSLLIDASGKSCDRALEGAAKSSNCTEARRGGGTRGGSSLEAESALGQVRPALDMRWEVEVRFLLHPPTCVSRRRRYWCPAPTGWVRACLLRD